MSPFSIKFLGTVPGDLILIIFQIITFNATHNNSPHSQNYGISEATYLSSRNPFTARRRIVIGFDIYDNTRDFASDKEFPRSITLNARYTGSGPNPRI